VFDFGTKFFSFQSEQKKNSEKTKTEKKNPEKTKTQKKKRETQKLPKTSQNSLKLPSPQKKPIRESEFGKANSGNNVQKKRKKGDREWRR